MRKTDLAVFHHDGFGVVDSPGVVHGEAFAGQGVDGVGHQGGHGGASSVNAVYAAEHQQAEEIQAVVIVASYAFAHRKFGKFLHYSVSPGHFRVV